MSTYERALRQFDAASFVRRLGGEKESGNRYSHEYLLPCPKCGSSRLRWNHLKDAWICWGCRRTGSTLLLVQLCLGVDELKAFDFIYAGYEGGDGQHAQLDAAIATHIPSQRPRLRRLPQIPWPPAVDRLDDHPAHAKAWRYLAGRGISPSTAAIWGLGFGRSGWLKDYLVFPVYMDDGLVYWQGRAAFDPAPGSAGRFRKTLNPRSDGEHATAAEVLLNYDRVRYHDHVVICEGPFDAMKIGPHAVALLGKSASEAKLARLLRLRARRFTVYLDRGDEERRHAEAIASVLSAQAAVAIAEPPEGYDPGALTPEQNAFVVERASRYRPQLSDRPLLGPRFK